MVWPGRQIKISVQVESYERIRIERTFVGAIETTRSFFAISSEFLMSMSSTSAHSPIPIESDISVSHLRI